MTVKNTHGLLEDPDEGTVKDTHGLPFTPVSLSVPAPSRRLRSQLPGNQRPVVVVVDTGVVDDHAWFQDSDADGPMLENAYDYGWAGPESTVYAPYHGTFVAGLVRQAAPDAKILSVTLARTDDGHIKSGQIREALEYLRDNTYFADVVCLAMGFPIDSTDSYAHNYDRAYARQVAAAIQRLGQRGTLVVASAGNTGEGGAAAYPAAEATDGPPLIAVGALESDGRIADFSTRGDWVRRYYYGVDCLSATPTQHYRWPGLNQEALAEELTGYGYGSGTSCAVATYAGRIAQALLAEPDWGTSVDAAAKNARLVHVLDKLKALDPQPHQ